MAQPEPTTAEQTAPTGPRYAHLHVHSEYSITDGAIRISGLLKKAKAEGHEAVALTDFTNMFGAVEFYSKAKELGIKPLLGAELLVAFPEAVVETFPKVKSQDAEATPREKVFNIVLLAKNLAGYKNLIKTVSLGFLDPASPNLPVVSWENLVNNAADIVAIDCMFNGLVSQLLTVPELADDRDTPLKIATDLMHDAFKDAYYLQLTENALPGQAQLMARVAAVGSHYQVPTVAAPLALYLNEDDREAHTVLTCVKNDLTLSDIRQRRQNARFHVLSNAEFAEVFADYPDAVANIATIVDGCKVSLEFGKYYLPNYKSDTDANIDDALRRLSREGLEERLKVLRPLYGPSFGEEQEKQYRDRLEFELDVIIKMGFPGYFLIVQDFINWAKRHGIPVGPGRGSGAGSLVAYSLRITDLDPIPCNLIFERFLDPERVSMPDFDVDFCQDRRDEVIRYVTEHYGNQNVAQITTFGKMKAKAALRDVGRVLEVSYGKVDRVAKLIPNELEITLKDAMAKEPRIMEEANKDPGIADMINIALQLEGLCRHTSVHAAGVVISEGGMENYVPVYKDPTGSLITQYEMKNAEKVGLVKFDFLGLKTLTVIDRTVKLLHDAGHKDFSIDTIDLELKPVYDQLSLAHTTGIFQLEVGACRLCS
jgi:DNA polymerase-3 subunit alpha